MKAIATGMAEAIKYDTRKWVIELNDLSANQAFMGNALSSKYLMIGITSPNLESQISINSIPDDESQEIRVPICLEKCNSLLSGQLKFKGIEKLLPKWDIFFIDNRFNESITLGESAPINLRATKNVRSEHLKLIGYTKQEAQCSNLFELFLKLKPV